MIYGRSQQTLLPSWPELDSLVVSLGPFYTCAWCALERSTSVSAPVSSDPAVAQQLLQFLKSAGVVTGSSSGNGAVKRSLYEPVSWSYVDDLILPDDLDAALKGMLDAWRPTLDKHARLWIWRKLADREASAYLTSLLRRHRIGVHRVDEILRSQDEEWTRLSLGRKRYVLWSSVRGAASQFLSSGGNEDAALEVLSREMRRRTRWLVVKAAAGELRRTDYCFLPDTGWRRPLMIDVALESILKIGDDYWLAAPSLGEI